MKFKRVLAALALCLSTWAAPASAQPMTFEAIRFEAPEGMRVVANEPSPTGPFLRLARGAPGDAVSLKLEAISGPLAEFGGRITADTFADFALQAPQRNCASHTVLRRSQRAAEGAQIIDLAFECVGPRAQPGLRSQVVRSVSVFTSDTFTAFMLIYDLRPNAAETAEAIAASTDAVAQSVQPCGAAC